MTDGYLQPKVGYTIDDSTPERRRVVFQVEAGPHYDKVVLAFEGASGIDPTMLDDDRRRSRVSSGSCSPIRSSSPSCSSATTASRATSRPRSTSRASSSRARWRASCSRSAKGPRFTVRRVATSGNTVLDDRGAAAAAAGRQRASRSCRRRRARARQDPDAVLAARLQRHAVRLRAGHRSHGRPRRRRRSRSPKGGRASSRDIQVRGNRRTSERLVREQLEVSPDSRSTCRRWRRSRRNLYDTGAFSIGAHHQRRDREIPDADVAAAASAAAADEAARQSRRSPDGQKPVQLNVVVREVQPIQLRYGASYDTERGIGGILDVSQHNSLGEARVIGLRSRYDAQLQRRPHLHEPAVAALAADLRRPAASTTARSAIRPPRSPTHSTSPVRACRFSRRVSCATPTCGTTATATSTPARFDAWGTRADANH